MSFSATGCHPALSWSESSASRTPSPASGTRNPSPRSLIRAIATNSASLLAVSPFVVAHACCTLVRVSENTSLSSTRIEVSWSRSPSFFFEGVPNDRHSEQVLRPTCSFLHTDEVFERKHSVGRGLELDKSAPFQQVVVTTTAIDLGEHVEWTCPCHEQLVSIGFKVGSLGCDFVWVDAKVCVMIGSPWMTALTPPTMMKSTPCADRHSRMAKMSLSAGGTSQPVHRPDVVLERPEPLLRGQ